MISQADEVLARVKIAVEMLPYIVDVPITDDELVEAAEQAPPASTPHSAFVAREFILERQSWLPLGNRTQAEAVLRPLAQTHGCELRLDDDAFVFFKRPSHTSATVKQLRDLKRAEPKSV
ncbi:MAG TPA: hypothetical protein VJ728_14185 [Candidatus Binataceae bacterium]|nr:hypothetical protein [Candidatus Binataceae bacterium]